MNHLYPTSHIKLSLGIFSKVPLRGCIQYTHNVNITDIFIYNTRWFWFSTWNFIFFYVLSTKYTVLWQRRKKCKFQAYVFFRLTIKKKCKLSFPSKGTYAYNLTARRIKVFFSFTICYHLLSVFCTA